MGKWEDLQATIKKNLMAFVSLDGIHSILFEQYAMFISLLFLQINCLLMKRNCF